jgi:hypothetical protein
MDIRYSEDAIEMQSNPKSELAALHFMPRNWNWQLYILSPLKWNWQLYILSHKIRVVFLFLFCFATQPTIPRAVCTLCC